MSNKDKSEKIFQDKVMSQIESSKMNYKPLISGSGSAVDEIIVRKDNYVIVALLEFKTDAPGSERSDKKTCSLTKDQKELMKSDIWGRIFLTVVEITQEHTLNEIREVFKKNENSEIYMIIKGEALETFLGKGDKLHFGAERFKNEKKYGVKKLVNEEDILIHSSLSQLCEILEKIFENNFLEIYNDLKIKLF